MMMAMIDVGVTTLLLHCCWIIPGSPLLLVAGTVIATVAGTVTTLLIVEIEHCYCRLVRLISTVFIVGTVISVVASTLLLPLLSLLVFA
jgi:hypothetical protein